MSPDRFSEGAQALETWKGISEQGYVQHASLEIKSLYPASQEQPTNSFTKHFQVATGATDNTAM